MNIKTIALGTVGLAALAIATPAFAQAQQPVRRTIHGRTVIAAADPHQHHRAGVDLADHRAVDAERRPRHALHDEAHRSRERRTVRPMPPGRPTSAAPRPPPRGVGRAPPR